MKNLLLVILTGVYFTQTIVFAGPKAYFGMNRISASLVQIIRVPYTLTGSSCEETRKAALDRGVITQDEYTTLKERGLYPIYVDYGDEPKRKTPHISEWLQAYTTCGCFHPSTGILAYQTSSLKTDHYFAKNIAFERNAFEVVHLTEDSKVGDFRFDKTKISLSTNGMESRPLVVIQTKDGRVLKLTETHPILTSQGMMVQAKDLTTQQSLMSLEGQSLMIEEIRSETFNGEVVNFIVGKGDLKKLDHVIFAEGIAVGDLTWQASLEEEQNKIFLRNE